MSGCLRRHRRAAGSSGTPTRRRSTAGRTGADRQHRLKGELGSRVVGGRNLAQWQYEVSGSGRIWYCPDPARRVVWLTLAATGHPRQTD